MPRAVFLLLLCWVVVSCGPTSGGSSASSSSGGLGPGVPPGKETLSCPAYDAKSFPEPLSTSATPSVGTAVGNFSVSPSGQANYTIPITVPPGRAGMAPQLTISYDSSAGESYMGTGFSLSGLSSIRRCTSNIDQDGYIRSVRGDSKDKLCLDGLRLVPVPSTDRRAQAGTIEFRTFPDTFRKIIGFKSESAGWTHFDVYTKPGHVLTYGGTPSGQVLGKGGAVVYAWWLTEEHDRHGNAVNYSYLNDVAVTEENTQELRPDQITYANGTIQFGWSALPDDAIVTTYEAGNSNRRAHQLASIETTNATKATTLREYKFAYDVSPSTSRHRLTSVSECAGKICKPPTTFAWATDPGVFTEIPTGVQIPQPQASVLNDGWFGTWAMADVNGDGLDDIVMSLQNVENGLLDDWYVSLNVNGSFGPAELWATLRHQASLNNALCNNRTCEENWTITPFDMDQDGNQDLFLTTPDPDANRGITTYVYIHSEPTAPPGEPRFVMYTTGIPLPNGVSAGPASARADYLDLQFARLGDVNGDGVADFIQCVNPTFQQGYSASPGSPTWTVRLWTPPADPAGTGGFGAPIPLPGTDALPCSAGPAYTYVVDVDGAAGSEIIVPVVAYQTNAPPWVAIAPQYRIIRYNAATPQQFDIVSDAGLLTQQDTSAGGAIAPLHFLDVNGDGLSDVLYTNIGTTCDPADLSICGYSTNTLPSGFPGDVPILGINSGTTFSSLSAIVPNSWPGTPVNHLGTDFYGASAFAVDYNGDGRMDLMMPVVNSCNDGNNEDVCWVAYLSSPAVVGSFDHRGQRPLNETPESAVPATSFMKAIPTGMAAPNNGNLPNNPLYAWDIPRVAVTRGQGRQDLIFPAYDRATQVASFTVRIAQQPQDLLLNIFDGLNPLRPSDSTSVPTVSIVYGSLVDGARARGASETVAAHDADTYLSQFDASNDCAYPRSCVVGSDRVVRAYALNNGANVGRSFQVKYRDGRYERLGRGFLGFGERDIIDLDRDSGQAEFYDNTSEHYDNQYHAYPFAGQVIATSTWTPASATQATATLVDMTYTGELLQDVHSEPGTYWTLSIDHQVTHAQASYTRNASQTLSEYVAASANGTATTLSHVTTLISNWDDYGTITGQQTFADGIDQQDTMTRSVSNDASTWLIGLVQGEQMCSSAGGNQLCRNTRRTFDAYGEVTLQKQGDASDPGTLLTVEFGYDEYGNTNHVGMDDAFGHHREGCVTYEPQGVFPYAVSDSLHHTRRFQFDLGLGVIQAAIDQNGLVTRFAHDGFGRTTERIRPDGVWTKFVLAREQNGGPQQNWWAVNSTTSEESGATITKVFDGALRPVSVTSAISATEACGQSTCSNGLTTVQQLTYDLFGRLTRSSVPWMVGDSLNNAYADTYTYDNIGRTTTHTEPWGRKTTYSYDGNTTSATDWLGTESRTVDALERDTLSVDKRGNETSTEYGPFSLPSEVTRSFADGPNEGTYLDRDAYGRVVASFDADRGETNTKYDGYGEPINQTDDLGRSISFVYDAVGRLVERDDTYPVGGAPQTDTTLWTYDTATHGTGLLASVTSPELNVDTFSYDTLSRPIGHTLTFVRTAESFSVTSDYDSLGRLWHTSYPTATGVPAMSITRSYDARGNLVEVQGAGSRTPLWTLQLVDGAGRYAGEALGNGVGTQRTYGASTGLLEMITAGPAAAGVGFSSTLQNLSYAYDIGLRMTSRSDALQTGPGGVATERFRHDALNRLTCAVFAPASCGDAGTIEYFDNGSIKSKAGVGTYSYDASHTHAVKSTSSGGATETYAYDSVGNQIARPGFASIQYTPFDLPATYTASAVAGSPASVELLYDGNHRRIRKFTDTGDTVYLDDLYQRVTDATGVETHKFFVAAGSSTVVVTAVAGGALTPSYALTDALGSTDVITDAGGNVVERRSYDAFGAQRNPQWGGPTATTYPNAVTTWGFTGQEEDLEAGLVNMRGRMYDPRLGRFLSTDPIVHDARASQAWNPYSYVWNSPLNFTDPSGFDGSESGEQAGSAMNTLGQAAADFLASRTSGDAAAPAQAGPAGAPSLAGGTTATSGSGQDDRSNATSAGDTVTTGAGGSVFSCSACILSPAALDANGHLNAPGDKFNPYTPDGRIKEDIFGAPPAPPEHCNGCDIATAMINQVPGIHAGMVLSDPNASTSNKVLAVATDVVAVFGGVIFSGASRAVAGVRVAEGIGVAAEAAPGVVAYEVGTYENLVARSVVGDDLALHHVGQAHAFEQVVPGFVRTEGASIALPTAEHRLIPNLRGVVGLTPRQILARDILNLRQFTNAPNSALRQLIQLNKDLYPGAFAP